MKEFAFENYGSKEETYVYSSNNLQDGFKAQKKDKFKQNNNEGGVGTIARNFFESCTNIFLTILLFIVCTIQSAFLPQGYPDSVSEDYLEYQIWDTAQAFCSSITGMLATQAVLKSYGVGDESATVLAASLTWMLKDGAGMVGRILFAWMKGTQLDCDAKRWRLHADVLNDAAIFLDLLAPLFKSYFILIACFSSIARSIVGVAGGSTRAALTLHQARRDNMADVSAKDGSQETLVNLMALISGFIITPLVAEKPIFVWTLFLIFTFLHLFSNYRAVSTVIMETVNMPRLCILLTNYMENNKTKLTPKQVSKLDPVIRAPGYTKRIKIGTKLSSAIASYNQEHNKLKEAMYMVGYCPSKGTISVALHKSCSKKDIIKASTQSLLIDILLTEKFQKFHEAFAPFISDVTAMIGPNSTKIQWNVMEIVRKFTDDFFESFYNDLVSNGWDLDRCHLGPDEWRYTWKDKTL